MSNSKMGSVLKSSTIYTILAFLPFASRILVLPFFLHYLTPKDFGLIGLTTTISTFLPVFLSLGLDQAFSLHYFHYKKSSNVLNAYISTLFISILAISSIGILCIIPLGDSIHKFMFKDPSFSFYPFGINALFVSIITSLNSLLMLYYRNIHSLVQFSLFSGGMFFCSLLSEIVGLMYFKCSAEDILWIRLTVSCLFCALFWLKLFYKIGISFERRLLLPSLNYSIPITPYVFLSFTYTYYDRIMIENKLTIEDLAIYNLAAAIASMVDTLINALLNTSVPLIYQKMKDGVKQSEEYVSKIYKGMGWLTLFLVGTLLFSGALYVSIFLKPIYHLTLVLLPMLLIGYIFRYLFTIYVDPLFFFKKTKWLPWLNVIAAVVLIFSNKLLLPTIGLIGAAISMILSRGLQLIATYIMYLKVSEFRYQMGYMKKIIIVLICILTAISFIGLFKISIITQIGLFSIPLVFILVSFLILIYKKGNVKGISQLNFSKLKEII